jgi:hypothetical protein
VLTAPWLGLTFLVFLRLFILPQVDVLASPITISGSRVISKQHSAICPLPPQHNFWYRCPLNIIFGTCLWLFVKRLYILEKGEHVFTRELGLPFYSSQRTLLHSENTLVSLATWRIVVQKCPRWSRLLRDYDPKLRQCHWRFDMFSFFFNTTLTGSTLTVTTLSGIQCASPF